MQKVLILAFKELGMFFDSLVAYVLLVIFLGLTGYFTWLSGNNIFFSEQASLQLFFAVSYWTLLFFIPALTMRSLSEEQRNGTLEWLVTKPISMMQIIIGKFLSVWGMVLVALICTLPYYITVANLGNIDHGAVWGGYAGLVLVSMAYIGLGLFASSLTQQQVVAFLITLCVLLFFHFICPLLTRELRGFWGDIFYFLASNTHFQNTSRGVIDLRDLVYFFSIAALGLVMAQRVLRERII